MKNGDWVKIKTSYSNGTVKIGYILDNSAAP